MAFLAICSLADQFKTDFLRFMFWLVTVSASNERLVWKWYPYIKSDSKRM